MQLDDYLLEDSDQLLNYKLLPHLRAPYPPLLVFMEKWILFSQQEWDNYPLLRDSKSLSDNTFNEGSNQPSHFTALYKSRQLPEPISNESAYVITE